MSRGRKPLPVEIHRLRGSFRADRHNVNAPQPTSGIPACPKHLNKTAKTEYRRVGKLLAACRVITEVDRAALAAYSQAWARLVQGEIKLHETGLIIKSPNGFPCLSPYLSVVRQAAEEVRRWAAELGLSPSARTRLHVEPAEPQNSKTRLFRVG